MSELNTEQLRILSETALSRWTIELLEPKSIGQLLSGARSEFIVSFGKYDGRLMADVRRLFNEIAAKTYQSRFVWSDYNISQWLKFVQNEIGIEGGACMFSLEDSGELPDPIDNTRFKGLGVGKPLGMFPYELFPVIGDYDALIKTTIANFTYTPKPTSYRGIA